MKVLLGVQEVGEHWDVHKIIPANYMQLAGYVAAASGRPRQVSVPVFGGTAAYADLALFNAQVVAGKMQPHELLALGKTSGALPSAGEHSYFAWSAGAEGTERAPNGPLWSGNAASGIGERVQEQPTLGKTIEGTWHWRAESGEGFIGEGTFTMKLTRIAEETGGGEPPWFTPYLYTAFSPFENGTRIAIGPYFRQPNEVEYTIEGFAGFPVGTIGVELVQTAGTPIELAIDVTGVGANDIHATLKHQPERSADVTLGSTYFLGVIPRGGNLDLALSQRGGGLDRHKAGGEFVDNPAVVSAGEGAEGEDAPQFGGVGKLTGLAQLI